MLAGSLLLSAFCHLVLAGSLLLFAFCCHRQRRLLRQAAALIVRRRLLPSETFRFAPSRRLPLRSFRVLATSVARPGASRSAFAPPIHMAMGGHGFREGTACACLSDDRSRLPRQHHTSTPHRQHIGNNHDLTPPQPLYQLINWHLNRHLRKRPCRWYRWLAVTEWHQVLAERLSAVTLSARCWPAIS